MQEIQKNIGRAQILDRLTQSTFLAIVIFLLFFSSAFSTVTPNDTYYQSNQSATMALMGIGDAWEISTGSKGVTVAVIDTGIDCSNPELLGQLATGYDFVSQNIATSDPHGQGTFLAGILGAKTNNNNGMAGILWNASLMPLRVLDGDGIGTITQLSDGIIYAADHGARVINLSLGAGFDASIQSAINYAYSKGCVIVASAGDNHAQLGAGDQSPICNDDILDKVIGVSAVDTNNVKLYEANYSSGFVDLVAVGDSVFSLETNTYNTRTGTSVAAPFVSGLAALMLSKAPHLSPVDVKNIMYATAQDVNGVNPTFNGELGHGLVRFDRALQFISNHLVSINISNPTNNGVVNGIINIKGTAISASLNYISVHLSPTLLPNQRTTLSVLSQTMFNQTVATLDTTSLPSGSYKIEVDLKANDVPFIVSASITFSIQNQPMCKISETNHEYYSLQEAIDAAATGQHIYLYPGKHTGTGNTGISWPNINNISLMASPGNSSLNVILDAGGNNRHFLQTNPVNWSIENITLMNGAVSTDNVGDNLGGSIYIAAPNQLLTLTSCIISNNIAYMGGAIGSIPGAEVVISACAIKNNHASKYGGAFAYVNTTLNASVVSGNISDENGGAAYSGNHQWINSLALGNTALDSGGVYLDGSHQWTNCRAYANSANYGGVGYGGELIASTSIIAFNHTNLSGTWTYSTTNILACTINNNTASQNGGVFYRGTHEIRNSLIFSNTAQGLGGVIAQGTITINNCIVSGNRAQRGGFAFQNTATVIVQTLLLNNMATVSGGVLFNGDNRLVNCTVVGNSPEAYYDSASGGGANGELDASNTLFVDSLAAASGSYLITVTLNNCLSSAALSNFVNASIGDYRLLPSSSGANAGDTAAWLAVSNNNPNDLGGSPRIVGGVIDIGAYESSSIATSNHAPSLTASSPQTFSEGQAVVLAWSTSDIDGDAVTVSISGWVTSNSYIASYTDSGNHTVYLNASDGHGGFASATINVIILNVNRAPSLNTASSVSFNEGQAVVLTWNVSDPDGDTVTVSISGWVTNNSYVATYTDSGNHTVYLNASDGRGGFATATINVIIKNINRAPSLNTSSTVSFNEGQAVVLTWNVSDPDGDTVTVSISGWITNNSYLASYTDSGNHTVYLNASDGHGGFASATINVVIRNVNRAPILSTSLTVNFNAGDPVILTWNASDPDGDSVTVSISGWITNNSYIAVLADSGNHTVYLTASDGRGGFASTSINILIRSVNHAPTINSVANISFNEGQAVILTWNVSDSDGDSVTVSISGWITNNNYIASFTDSGNHVVYLTASDGHGGFASATINISIINTPSDNIVRISQFYIAPNPYNAYFTGSNSILHLTYSLSCDAAVKIIVYNIAGRRIKDWNLTPGFEGSRFGKNHLQWDGLTGSGEKLSTGIYFVKIMATSSAGSDKSEFTIMVLK